jgi:glycosyltransferase involved in cell wall biosynthesis
MRLGIDAREIQEGVYTGIGRPLANFLQYFNAQDNEDRCILFSIKEVPIHFGPRISNVIIPGDMTFIWDQWHLPQAIKKAGVDIFYSPYYKIPLLKPCRTISAILDLMYLAYDPYYQTMDPLAKIYYATFGLFYANRADRILTCSQYSKKDIQRIYGVHPEKIVNIPLSVASLYFSPKEDAKIAQFKQKFNISNRYILYTGNFKPHKNIESLIHAFATLALEFKDVNLVLAGPKEHAYSDLLKIIESYQLSNRIIFTGKIMDSDGPQYLYQGAEVFVMPTFYEGFGLPPLEAMACAVPVVASNATSVGEVVGDAAILINPKDISEIANAIRRILTSPTLAQELIQKGLALSQNYKTEKIAQAMYDFFKAEAGKEK